MGRVPMCVVADRKNAFVPADIIAYNQAIVAKLAELIDDTCCYRTR